MGLLTLPAEIRAIRHLLNKNYRGERKLVFYSESSIYYLYYEGLIKHLLTATDYLITYITSDPEDPVFALASDRFKVFHISNNMLAFTTGLLEADKLIFTMPDLHNYHVKRSIRDVEHIYVFHAVMSTHMIYRRDAFIHYDTIFCVGPHHFEEIRETEKLYSLQEKRLIEVGYPLLEKIHREHLDYEQSRPTGKNESPTILIAPSWNSGNIFETCIDELLSRLNACQYRIILRPHPEVYKRNRSVIKAIIKEYGSHQNFELETKLTAVDNFHLADLLITDWSGIAFEYAFGTERPVLFINTPKKIFNSDYERIGIEPLEVTLRDKIGVSMELNELADLEAVVNKLLGEKENYKEDIKSYRQEYIYNWGRSAEVGSRYLIETGSG